MNSRNLYMGGFLIAATINAYYDIKHCQDMPWPPRIVATGVVFILLDLFVVADPQLAGVIAIGFALAMLVHRKTTDSCHKPACDKAAQPSDVTTIRGQEPGQTLA